MTPLLHDRPRSRWLLGLLLVLPALAAVPAAGAQSVAPGTCVPTLTGTFEHDAQRVTLTWEPVAGATWYDVHLSVNGGPFQHLTVVAGDVTTFVDDPAPGGVLEYIVSVDGHPVLNEFGQPPDDCPRASGHLDGPSARPGTPACATGLTATSDASGTVRLQWDPVAGALRYNVLRAVGDGPLEPHAMLPGDVTTFEDPASLQGVTYRYAVVANGPGTLTCPTVTVTAIPFFPSFGAALLAGVAGIAGLALWRRR